MGLKMLPLTAINEGFLKVSNEHEIYYASYGNKNGIPVVVCHGGPGSNSKPKHALRFDLNKYYVVLFDQRGAGKSIASNILKNNSTQNLIEDMEKLRKHFGFNRWVVSGSSWGSTLAILYAQSYSEKVMGLLLSAIFLARKSDVEWMYSTSGAGKFFPKELNAIQKEFGITTTEIANNAFEKITNSSKELQKENAVKFLSYSGKLCSMEESQIKEQQENELLKKSMSDAEIKKMEEGFTKFAITHTTLELYYQINNFFIEENQILNNIHKIENIPTFIVQGRYDLICPPAGAYELHKSLKNSNLNVVANAGHDTSEMKEQIEKSSKLLLNKLLNP